jgi:hypothetical protein
MYKLKKSVSHKILPFLFLLLPQVIIAQGFRTDSVYYGEKEYIEYLPGNLPLIFAASHGGYLTPASIPVRSCAGCVTVMDANTQELARLVREAIFRRSGCYPHLIINRLRRNRLDANRDIGEAALGNPEAEQAWREYHGFIDTAKQTVVKKFNRGIFIDLHGHGHSIQRLELGYLLSGSTLRLSNMSLNASNIVLNSSIRKLTEDNLKRFSHVELLRGTFSLGALLEKNGYASVPSESDPAPRSGDDYFSGGYSTDRHGSVEGTNIDAIQIECNFQGVRDSEPALYYFADALAAALTEYMKTHYFESFPSCQIATSVRAVEVGNAFQVFPNPGCGTFFLKDFSPDYENLDVTIFDASGRTRLKTRLTSAGLELPQAQFPNGLYWFIAQQASGQVMRMPLLQQCGN